MIDHKMENILEPAGAPNSELDWIIKNIAEQALLARQDKLESTLLCRLEFIAEYVQLGIETVKGTGG